MQESKLQFYLNYATFQEQLEETHTSNVAGFRIYEGDIHIEQLPLTVRLLWGTILPQRPPPLHTNALDHLWNITVSNMLNEKYSTFQKASEEGVTLSGLIKNLTQERPFATAPVNVVVASDIRQVGTRRAIWALITQDPATQEYLAPIAIASIREAIELAEGHSVTSSGGIDGAEIKVSAKHPSHIILATFNHIPQSKRPIPKTLILESRPYSVMYYQSSQQTPIVSAQSPQKVA